MKFVSFQQRIIFRKYNLSFQLPRIFLKISQVVLIQENSTLIDLRKSEKKENEQKIFLNVGQYFILSILNW